ncbi:unnamed protein product [Moneuplotes crassus]|uniref:RING-type domain-containing protein n=1 Tax=Euplotes crassus TaxID=5936 RepID=A0AAD1UMW8_EUPCR|nr:unnamed protein product [Moneuplotes crassus]
MSYQRCWNTIGQTLLVDLTAIAVVLKLSLPFIQAFILYYMQPTKNYEGNLQEICPFNNYFDKGQMICEYIPPPKFENSMVGHSAWQEKSFEICYIVSTFFISTIYALALKSKNNNLEWFDMNFGGVILTIFYFIRNKDFCTIVSRMYTHEFYPSVDIIMLVVLIIQILYGLFFQIIVICDWISYQRNKVEVHNTIFALCLVFSIIFMDFLCLLISFCLEPIVLFLCNNYYVVFAHNSFWISLVFYSAWTRKRLKSTLTLESCILECLRMLAISFDLTFSINYFYIFKTDDHTFKDQIRYIMTFLSLHVLLILSYIYHQCNHCNRYAPNGLNQYASQTHDLSKDFTLLQIEKKLIPDCVYCLNSLIEPCVGERARLEEVRISEYLQYSLSRPTTYIKVCCGHLFHPSCFLTIKTSTSQCPICQCTIGGVVI